MAEFLLIRKQCHPTFPPTKIRPGEDLYHAMVRPMEEDLGLPPDGYFPEEELQAIPNAGESPRYPGLQKQWYLYPVVISLAEDAQAQVEMPADDRFWCALDKVFELAQEPNVCAIARYIQGNRRDLLTDVPAGPSMDAMACRWAASHGGGVRVVRGVDIRRILGRGSRAFNLRVADPYLPYQRQGLGYTWSFFTPKDTQDIHVHPLPAVEIYGVIEGRLQLWHKPMNQRGVRTWKCQTLAAGDWAEVEPLHCHFAYWLDREGLGTVLKAAATGELAGVGRLGIAGKTNCDGCSISKQCLKPPDLIALAAEYGKPFEVRDYRRIADVGGRAEEAQNSLRVRRRDGG